MSQKPVKLADVARAAGVSQGTASNVFSRPEIVREEVRERVLKAAAELDYAGPDPRGRLLRAGRVNAIGVATAEPLSYFFEDPFARIQMRGISEVCDANGLGISLVSADSQDRLAWNMQSAVVDGFVLFCVEGWSGLVGMARERGLPFVALDLGIDDPAVPAIGIDNAAAAALAAEHLVALGHRRFGVIAMPLHDGTSGPTDAAAVAKSTYSDTRNRLAGYLSVLEPAGIDAAALPIYETQNDRPTVFAALEHLMGLSERPTALLCMSDRIALYALDWLAARGIRVPQDISVMGFDGIPEAALSEPALTTIAQPIAEIGRRAVESILAGEGPRRQTLPVERIIRASTGPALAQ
jgi:DNA-binding LacI/PurR family transcriptional regulator